MIYHINRFAIKKDTPEDQLSHAHDLLHRIGEELVAVEFYCVGRDIGGEFDVGAMYALKDIDAYRAYMFAPIHEEADNASLPHRHQPGLLRHHRRSGPAARREDGAGPPGPLRRTA